MIRSEVHAELWRRLHAQVAAVRVRDPAPGCAGAGDLDLPSGSRVRDVPGQLQVLRALADARVHLFLLHPSPALWSKIAALGARVSRRAEDPTATLAANRLLASWGQDSRELQLVLGPT